MTGYAADLQGDAGIHVLSVDYRLAPEHKAPAAVDDCVAAYRWALEHAAELDADPTHIGVGGDSAGGNLAALVALRSRDEGIRQPATLQALLYPGLDLSAKTRSRTLFSDGFFLSKQDMDWFTKLYLDGAGIAADDPRVSPPKAADLSGLAPALVLTAELIPCATRATNTPRRCARPVSAWTTASSMHSPMALPVSRRSAAAAPMRSRRPSRPFKPTSAAAKAAPCASHLRSAFDHLP